MVTHNILAVPVDVLDRITNLAIDDNRRQGPAELAAADLSWAFAYLDRLLLGGAVLVRHLAHLEKLYNAVFRRFASRRDRTPEEPAIPSGPDTRFRYHALLTEPQGIAILQRGSNALRDKEFFPQGGGVESVRLLLNPYALWDLADLVDTLLPDYWLSRQTDYAQELAAEVGIDLMPGTPLVDKPTREKSGNRELAFATRAMTGVLSQARPGDKNRREIELPEWAKRKVAAVAFGDSTLGLTLFLHRIPRGTDAAQAELEMRPAPTKNDVTLTVRFGAGEERSFVLEVPDETRQDPNDTRDGIRSNSCEVLPGEAFQFTSLDCEAVGEWFRVVFRPD